MTITHTDLTPFQELLTTAARLRHVGGSAESLSETAVDLARHIKEAQTALEPLKAMIRDLARSERGSGHHVGYTVPGGRVSVTFPEQRYEARKDADWTKARKDLGTDFDKYFLTVTTVRARTDINDLLVAEMERAQDSNADEVLQYLTLDEPTPRVGFKPDTCWSPTGLP